MSQIKLQFIKNFQKEYWFIKNKLNAAEKEIGKKRFALIVNYNIPNGYNKDKKKFISDITAYFHSNQKQIQKQISKKAVAIEKGWKKYGDAFFKQVREVTKVRWRYRTYKNYFVSSCFWGGDYDINKNNIYINPLIPQGDPLYVIFHELCHLHYWEHIYSEYSANFIKRNHQLFWELSEVMVNYPLQKIKINYHFPMVIPPYLKRFSSAILKSFPTEEFTDIIKQTIKKRAK